MARRRIILLGIGHTNAHVVHQWAERPIPDCDLVCINKFDSATYSGMLPGTMAGQFDDDRWRIDLRALCGRAGAELIVGETESLDLSSGRLTVAGRGNLSFDALSVGVGSVPAGTGDLPSDNTVVPIKPMQTLLARLDARIEAAKRRGDGLIRVAIVGGGVASVEIAFCLKTRLADPRAKLSVTLYCGDDHVAGGMSEKSVRKIERLLSDRDIAIHRGTRIGKVNETSIEDERGTIHETDVVIWATGAAAPPVLERLGLETDDRGFVATTSTLQSISDPRIFAVGDSGTVIQSPSPKAGVYAVRQCPILWHNLRAFLDGEPLREFEPQKDFLKLLNTGDGKAFLQYGAFTAHGRWCWHLKTWIDRRFIDRFSAAPSQAKHG